MTTRPDPPAWYDHERRTIWHDTVSRLTDAGSVFRADPRILDTYVTAYATHTAARLAAQTSPLVTRGQHVIENPALQVQRRAALELARISRALGLHHSPMRDIITESPLAGDGRRWCDQHGRRECKHNRKDGLPCHGHPPMDGTGACRMHVGMSAARARQKGQEFRAQVAELAEQPGPDGQPGSGLWFGIAQETYVDGELTERVMKPGPHAVLAAYDRERDRLVRVAAAAHTAGAQADAVNVAKALGAGVHALFDEVFHALQLTNVQWALVPQVVPPILAAYDPDAGPMVDPDGDDAA
jgi:P27 family predicted phage terminase small subunit